MVPRDILADDDEGRKQFNSTGAEALARFPGMDEDLASFLKRASPTRAKRGRRYGSSSIWSGVPEFLDNMFAMYCALRDTGRPTSEEEVLKYLSQHDKTPDGHELRQGRLSERTLRNWIKTARYSDWFSLVADMEQRYQQQRK